MGLAVGACQAIGNVVGGWRLGECRAVVLRSGEGSSKSGFPSGMTNKRQRQRKKQIPFGNDKRGAKAKEEADSLRE